MKHLSLLFLLLAAAVPCRASEPLPEPLVKRLTETIRAHCPEAVFKTEDGMFVAQHGTMLFTLHRRLRTGEVNPATYQEEGPNFKGFLLKMRLEKGLYDGPALVPQEVPGPYYPTFLNCPVTPDGQHHFWINFSYGCQLDPKLKQAVLDALPKANRPGN